jgi:molybdenum cofactor synthesis domain-containing protein
MSHASSEFIPAHIAILTVSDSRGAAEDTSGQYLQDAAQEAGHQVVDRAIVKDDIYQIRARVSAWIADDNVQAVLITGGTGFTARDNTPEALLPLFDRGGRVRRTVPHGVVRRDRHRDDPVARAGRPGEPHGDFRHAGLHPRLPHRLGADYRRAVGRAPSPVQLPAPFEEALSHDTANPH